MVKKKRHLIVRIILFILISLILGFGIYGMNAKMLMNDQMPMPLGFGIGVIMSGSMEPELSVDDLIFVVKDKSIELDDVIVYQSKGMLVVHKVVKIDGDQITTRGTANNTEDDPISIKNVKGRVAFSLGGMGKVVNVIRTPIVVIAILILAVYLLFRSYANEKNRKDEKDEKIEEIRKEIMRMKEERNKKQ